MATSKNSGKRGGKLPNKARRGMALEEFIDSAGVNSSETAVGSPPPALPAKRDPSAVGRAVEKILANPTLVIAGLAAIPILLVVWGMTRRRRRHEDEETKN